MNSIQNLPQLFPVLPSTDPSSELYKKVQKSLTRCLRDGLEGETVAAVSTPVLAEDAIFPAEGNERVKERPGCYLVINKVSRDYDATNPPPPFQM